MGDRSCLGDRSNAYSLGKIEIGEGAVVAQEAYLCTGTHDFEDCSWPLVTDPVYVGPRAFIGARAFIMPGVTVGSDTIIGACSVVTNDMPSGSICAGNPCKLLRVREAYLNDRYGRSAETGIAAEAVGAVR